MGLTLSNIKELPKLDAIDMGTYCTDLFAILNRTDKIILLRVGNNYKRVNRACEILVIDTYTTINIGKKFFLEYLSPIYILTV